MERKWSWDVVESNESVSGVSRMDSQRPVSRASSIMEVGQSLLRRMTIRGRSGGPRRVKAPLYELSEGGSLQMQMYLVSDIAAEDLVVAPDTVAELEQWFNTSRWFATEWYTGYLSQEGGDVKNWRRRFFKVVGAKMEAYHEFTHEYRTAIDLSQLVKVDREPGADEEEFALKNTFRLEFKHGEIIDFYANDEQEFAKWTTVLQKILDEMPDRAVYEPEAVEQVKSKGPRFATDNSDSPSPTKKSGGKRVATGFVRKAPSVDSTTRSISPEKVQASNFVGLFGVQQ